jgi:hypothetical protein
MIHLIALHAETTGAGDAGLAMVFLLIVVLLAIARKSK